MILIHQKTILNVTKPHKIHKTLTRPPRSTCHLLVLTHPPAHGVPGRHDRDGVGRREPAWCLQSLALDLHTGVLGPRGAGTGGRERFTARGKRWPGNKRRGTSFECLQSKWMIGSIDHWLGCEGLLDEKGGDILWTPEKKNKLYNYMNWLRCGNLLEIVGWEDYLCHMVNNCWVTNICKGMALNNWKVKCMTI